MAKCPVHGSLEAYEGGCFTCDEEAYRDSLGPMSTEEACRWILGRKVADAIIGDMGLRWCIVTAA